MPREGQVKRARQHCPDQPGQKVHQKGGAGVTQQKHRACRSWDLRVSGKTPWGTVVGGSALANRLPSPQGSTGHSAPLGTCLGAVQDLGLAPLSLLFPFPWLSPAPGTALPWPFTRLLPALLLLPIPSPGLGPGSPLLLDAARGRGGLGSICPTHTRAWPPPPDRVPLLARSLVFIPGPGTDSELSTGSDWGPSEITLYSKQP